MNIFRRFESYNAAPAPRAKVEVERVKHPEGRSKYQPHIGKRQISRELRRMAPTMAAA
jgi:hypothetical protein